MESSKKKSKVTPWKLVGVFIVQLNESYQINMLFPFVVFMIRTFKDNIGEQSIGYYAGMLTAAFCVCEFFSSFAFGKLSDYYGRQVVLAIGCFLHKTCKCLLFLCFVLFVFCAFCLQVVFFLLRKFATISSTFTPRSHLLLLFP